MSEESTQEQAQPESISINDLASLLQIVDLASSRGAFRGGELTQVGTLFDKLNTFLTYVSEQQKEAQDSEPDAEIKE